MKKSALILLFFISTSLGYSQASNTTEQDSASSDSAVEETKTLPEVERFSGPTSDVEAVAIAPNEKYLAAGGWDKNIYIISLDTANWGEVIHTLSYHNSAILSLNFNRNGEYLIAGSNDREITIWNIDSALRKKVLRQDAAVNSADFGPSLRYALTADKDGVIKLWDTKDSKRTKTIKTNKQLSSIVLARDKRSIYVASTDITISQFNLSGTEIATLEGHTSRINDIALSSNGALLASGSDDKSVIVYDTRTRKIKYTLKGHSHKVNTVTFSSDNNYLVSGSNDGEVIIWDMRTGEKYKSYTNLGKRVRDVSMSRKMEYIAVACYEDTGDDYVVYFCRTGLENAQLKARERSNSRGTANPRQTGRGRR